MNNTKMYLKMCEESSVHTIPECPRTRQLFQLILNNRGFKTAREAILDITKWLEVNQYSHEWSLDMILLAYYMRTQYATCWDTVNEQWVKMDEILDKKLDELEGV